MKIGQENRFVGDVTYDDGVVYSSENNLLSTQTVTKYVLHANKYIVGSRIPYDRTFIVVAGKATVEVSPALDGPHVIVAGPGDVIIVPKNSFFNLKNSGDFKLTAIMVTTKE